jgi:hypothetical protein
MDIATPVDLDLTRLHLQRGQDLEIRSESRGKTRVAPQPRKEAEAKFTGNRLSGGQVIRSLVAAGLADDDVLAIGKRPDFGFLGRQRLLTEVSRHTDLSWIGVPGNAVASCSVDVADYLLDIDRLRTGGNAAVDEHAIGVDGDLDSDQSIRLLPHGGGDDGFRNRVGQPVGMPRRNVCGVLVHGLGN